MLKSSPDLTARNLTGVSVAGARFGVPTQLRPSRRKRVSPATRAKRRSTQWPRYEARCGL